MTILTGIVLALVFGGVGLLWYLVYGRGGDVVSCCHCGQCISTGECVMTRKKSGRKPGVDA